jgi:hypothetical protein
MSDVRSFHRQYLLPVVFGYLPLAAGLCFDLPGSSTIVFATLVAFSFFLPGLAMVTLIRLPAFQRPEITIAGVLLSLHLLGLAAYWCYFFSPEAGKWFSLFVYSVTALLLVIKRASLCKDMPGSDLGRLSLIVNLVFVFSWAAGFLYGGFADAVHTAEVRYTGPLPGDNRLPLVVAQYVLKGGIPQPLVDGWYSSDRPPLQSGLYLLFEPLLKACGIKLVLGYQVVSMACQLSWIWGAYCALLCFRISPKARALCLTLLIFGSSQIINSFYVWPKLLGAGDLFLVLGLLFGTSAAVVQLDPRVKAVMLGTAAVLSILAHPGSLFALLACALVGGLYRRLPSIRHLATAAVAAAAIYGPWLWFVHSEHSQQRLLKWHLAGVTEPTDKPLLELMKTAYADIGLVNLAKRKIENLVLMTGTPGTTFVEQFALSKNLLLGNAPDISALARIRARQFYYLGDAVGLPALLGLLAFALAALLPGRGKTLAQPEARTAVLFAALAAAVVLAWDLTLFMENALMLHAGTLVLPMLVSACCLLGIWSVSRISAVVICVASCLFSLETYFFTPPVTTGLKQSSLLLPEMKLNVFYAAVMVCALLAAVRVMIRDSKAEPE